MNVVRIDCASQVSPVWDWSAPIELAQLEIDDELRHGIAAEAALLREVSSIRTDRRKKQWLEEYDARGLQLARRLQSELGTSAKVLCVQQTSGLLSDPDELGDRHPPGESEVPPSGVGIYRLMCDYATDPLWTWSLPAELDVLPIPDGLRKELRAWGHAWERSFGYDADASAREKYSTLDHDEIGLQLARRLQRYLEGSAKVVLFSEVLRRLVDPDDFESGLSSSTASR